MEYFIYWLDFIVLVFFYLLIITLIGCLVVSLIVLVYGITFGEYK